jgi:hypothetical protein
MRFQRTTLAIALLIGTGNLAAAFAPDGCEQQRALYPTNWNDTATEKALFTCQSRRDDPVRIKIGASDSAGRTLMSVVPLARSNLAEQTDGVLRIWLDKEQTSRLREGKYFATIVRKENSCWIRGDISEDIVFFMDNANPPPDDKDAAGEFYNKAPRFSVFRGEYYNCEPAK